MEPKPYLLEKLIWSDADFEQMGWHDVYIYAFGALAETFELVFDIDYILDCVLPTLPDQHYRFWIAPATLVFENVHDIKFRVSSQGGYLILDDLQRSNEQLTPSGTMTDWL